MNEISVVAQSSAGVNINMKTSILTHKYVLINASLALLNDLISMFCLTECV